MDSEVEGVQIMVISIDNFYVGISLNLIHMSSDCIPIQSHIYSAFLYWSGKIPLQTAESIK